MTRCTCGSLAGVAAILSLLPATPAAAGGIVDVTTKLITFDVNQPTSMTRAPGDAQRLFYTERAGLIRILKDGAVLLDPFVDLSALVNSSPPERAMSGLAFHPDYQSNGLFYVTYTNLDGDSVLARLTVTADPEVADAGSHEVVLLVPEPGPTHNVGWIGFGPADGYLYVAVGDGGNNTGGVFAQDTSELLGKILRIDVNGDDFPDEPDRNYAIPPTNPFVGEPGRDEIWAYGLRNPWRCSFDRLTHDLWIGDVGQSAREEVDFLAAGVAGANFGWNCEEGDICHEPANGCTCGDASLTAPVHVYDHGVGCAVIGGYVYRGAAITGLQGHYVFADLCAGKLWARDPSDGMVIELLDNVLNPYSFGEDVDGELYLLAPLGIFKLVFVDCNDNGVPDADDILAGTSDDCNVNGVPDECEADCNDNAVPDDCDIANGTSFDNDGNGIPDECDQLADLDGDGVVGITDFLTLLAAWGPCDDPCPPPCVGDIDGDCHVGITDFLILLASWGPV